MSEVWIQLKPFGINLTGAGAQPLLLLKDSSGELTLPLRIPALEVGILLGQSGKAQALTSPHLVTEQILKALGASIQRCVLYDVKAQHLMARLELSNGQFVEIRADQAVSLILYLNVPIFTTRELVWKARNLNVELQTQDEGLVLFQSAALRPHEYLM
jgi:hypothetical protein